MPDAIMHLIELGLTGLQLMIVACWHHPLAAGVFILAVIIIQRY